VLSISWIPVDMRTRKTRRQTPLSRDVVEARVRGSKPSSGCREPPDLREKPDE